MGSERENTIGAELFWNLGSVARKLLFSVLSMGPIPRHIAFILDGNRRYANKWNLTEGGGHNAGFLNVIRMLKYCYELGIKTVSIYAFSIDNYRRKPQLVKLLMNLMRVKMEELVEVEGLVHHFGVRIYFCGNLNLLSPDLKVAAERVMAETKHNTKAVLCVNLAYTSTDEITHSIQVCCDQKLSRVNGKCNAIVDPRPPTSSSDDGDDDSACAIDGIGLGDVERNMYMAVAPETDILVRTSGETRLSNYLLWQTGHGILYSPQALWPELGMFHLVWTVLNFQRSYSYLEKIKKKQEYSN